MSYLTISAQGILYLIFIHMCWKWLAPLHFSTENNITYVRSPWRIFGRWRDLLSSKTILHETYQSQICDDEPRALRGIFSDCVVLPPSMIKWLLLQSEDDLSAKWAQMDSLNIPMTFVKSDIGINPVHEPLVRRQLTANLDLLAGLLHDEVTIALEESWGTKKDTWQEVNLDFTIRRIVARAANRVFVGDRLCRNKHYIESCIKYVTRVSTCGLLINLLPLWLRGTFGAVFTLPIRVAYSHCSKHLLPMMNDMISGQTPVSPHLFSTWLVENLTKMPSNSLERTPDYLSRRIMALNFAVIHTSTFTTVNLLLDVFSSHSSTTVPVEATESRVRALRDEALANRVRWDGDMRWNRARLNQMTQIDSALRESMRRWGVVPKALSRKVMRPQGVVLPNGQRLSCGTIVCVSGWGLHHDEEMYAQPFDFIYDRFVNGSPSLGKNESVTSAPSATAAVETSHQFVAWGIGKHACPGRFFAVDLIKIVLTRILLDYEVKLGEMRPENIWIEYNVAPPPMATLCVRKR